MSQYPDPASRSAALFERARKVMPGGNTRTILYNAPFPIRAASAQGSEIVDIDGHRYLDLVGEYSAGIYGHSHPGIRAVIDKAPDHGWNFGGRHENEGKLAKLIADRMPSIDLVRFTNSGT